MSAAEQAFLDAHPRIEFGIDAAWEPHIVIEDTGAITGYDADILARIKALTGANIQLVPGRWEALQEHAKRHEIDGLSCSGIHPERRSYLSFSDVYNESRYRVLVPKGNPLGLKTRADLVGRSIAIQRGNLSESKLVQGFPRSRIVELDSVDAMIEAVASGEVDAAFDTGALLLYRSNRIGTPYLQAAFALDESLELVFSVRNDWPELVSIINKGLAAIDPSERARLQARWFLAPMSLARTSVKASLTDAERAALEHLGTLRLCVDPDWMPMSGVLTDGRYQGILIDLIEILGRRLGLSFARVPTVSWEASLNAMRAGRCDLVAGAAMTPDRQDYLAFTPALLSEPLVVVIRQESEFKGRLELHADSRFAAVSSHASVELLRRAYPAIRLVEMPDVVTGLRAVQSGEVFGYIDLIPPVAYAAQQQAIIDIKIAGNLPQRYTLAIGVQPDRPLLRSSLSKAVASLEPAEIKAVRDRWTSVRYEQPADYRWLWPYVLGGLALLTIVIAWNRRLARLNAALNEANTRIAELSITDPLTGIPNRRHFNGIMSREWRRARRDGSPFNLMLIDVDHFKEYNDTAGHLAGDQVLIQIGALLRRHGRRGGDFCFRTGGEEFVLLERTLGCADAMALAEAIRADCEGLAIPHRGRSVAPVVTLSIGVLCAQSEAAQGPGVEKTQDWEALYQRVDALLYAAKDQGRNRVVADRWMGRGKSGG